MASNMPGCVGGQECCWVEGKPCPHLDGDLCGLRTELGSWDAVHEDPRYKEYPQPVWQARGIADCGEYVCEDCVLLMKEQ
jgi:hypothetical protein